MMNETLHLVSAFVTGALLGLMFFGGLWWTVHKAVSSKQPALWVFAGLLLRMSITLSGFYWVSGGHWERLTVCLIGFFMVRLILTRLTRTADNSPILAQEAGHAPESR